MIKKLFMKKEPFIFRYKTLLIISPIVLAVISIILLLRIKVNSDLNAYFPETLTSKVNQKKIEAIFGKDEMMMIVLEADDVLNPETLKRIQAIDDTLEASNVFSDVMSLFGTKNIRGEECMMLVDPAIPEIPTDKESIEALRKSLKENELAYKLFVSDDFKYALFIMTVKEGVDDKEVVRIAQHAITINEGPEQAHLFGLPYLRVESNEKITRDFLILLPIGLILMISFLFISFREKRGVWLPMLVVVLSTLVSLALLPVMGWDLSLVGIIIPIMMIAIANNYGVHIIARYQEVIARHPEFTNKEVILEVYNKLKIPVILTGLTTIVGILGLVAHTMIPASQMGVISGLGVGFALWMSLSFIPATLVIMKKGKVHKDFSSEKSIEENSFLRKPAAFTTKKPWLVIFIFISFLIVAASGFQFFKIAPDNNKVMPESHPYNKALKISNEHFGGTRQISLVFKGDIKDPEILKRMDFYEKEIEKQPQTGSVTSIATMLRVMGKALNDPNDPLYGVIPDSREAVAQYLELYTMSGDPEDLENFVDFSYEHAIMNIQFQAHSMKELNQLIDFITNLTAQDPALYTVGGYCLLEKEMSDSIVTGQNYSLLFAMLAIAILLMLIFRSLRAGLIGSIPLVFAIISMFGLMGWLGIELNIVTALLSSISIGVGVDYTIHLFWRIKTELVLKKDYPSAIFTALTTTGRGIAINAFSVMLGFSVLFFSQFPYLQTFAFLIILSLVLCLICALLLMPAICTLAKPKFLLKGNHIAESI